MDLEVAKVFAAAICMGLGTMFPALGEGMIGSKAIEALGRNPGARSAIVPNMIVGMALVESISIYALVIALIILFAI